MRDHEPVVHIELDHPILIDSVWVVSRHEDISAIDRDPQTWASNIKHPLIWNYAPLDPQTKPGLIVQDGDEHKTKRAMVGRGFRPARVQQLEQTFRKYAKQVVDVALEKREINFVDDVAHLMPVQALGDILGVPEADRAQFFTWVDTFASPFDERVATAPEKVGQALMELWSYGLDQVRQRDAAPTDDVFNQIAEMHVGDDEVQGNVALFASGAAETTRAALCHGMHELMRNPEQMAWLRERQHDIPPTVAQEFVRIGNAIISLCRVATRDVELHGRTIREGEQVAMLFAAGNFDERALENPRAFDLARDPNPHLGFGRGVHACLGKHVAALEMKVLLEELFTRTKEIRPTGEIDYLKDNYSRGVYSLPVELIPA
ncbi:MAG: cytochrome P450 [Solirubrobacterales bacterium]|nr:cytochrome P450 [Solirubrobacterales bacterium]